MDSIIIDYILNLYDYYKKDEKKKHLKAINLIFQPYKYANNIARSEIIKVLSNFECNLTAQKLITILNDKSPKIRIEIIEILNNMILLLTQDQFNQIKAQFNREKVELVRHYYIQFFIDYAEIKNKTVKFVEKIVQPKNKKEKLSLLYAEVIINKNMDAIKDIMNFDVKTDKEEACHRMLLINYILDKTRNFDATIKDFLNSINKEDFYSKSFPYTLYKIDSALLKLKHESTSGL
jgi:hypothetical protein